MNLPNTIMHVLATLAMLTGMTLAPVLPEPMPEAMTAGAVLTITVFLGSLSAAITCLV